MKALIITGIVFLASLILSAENSRPFSISVSGIENGSTIPVKFVRNTVKGGKNISPGISWKNVPAGTKSFAITCIDLNPMARKWVHWMVLNIASDVKEIPESASLNGKTLEMINSFGNKGYDGPQPPSGSGLHEYVLTVYALSAERFPVSEKQLSEKDFLQLVKGKILAKASISNSFGR